MIFTNILLLMNLKRILLILAAVFLLATVCCGAAAAFTVEKEATVNPSGSLTVGDRVTATVDIKLPQGSVDTASKISFDSPLAGETWVVDIIKADTIVNTKHPSSPYLYITGFDLEYESDITIRINVSGTVPSSLSGKEISVLQITATGIHDAGVQSYSSPKQKVNGAAVPQTTPTPTPIQNDDTGISNSAKAFQITKEAVISPTGSLVPGERVTATVEIMLPQGTVTDSSKVSFDSPLTGDTWVVDIIKAGTIVNTKHPASPYLYISGFDLNYEDNITVRIAVTGTVSSSSSNQEIAVLQVTATGLKNADTQSYSSPKQYVHNTGNLNGELASLDKAITTLETKIASSLAEGYNVEMVKSYVEQAGSKYTAAQNAGTADAVTAFGNIEAGNELIKMAELELEQLTSGKTTEEDKTVSTPIPVSEIKPTTEPTQTEKQEYSSEFQRFIRELISWLESLLS